MRPDYYELLDIPPTANAAEIKAAYYRQAKKHHPDRNRDSKGAEERFKLIAEAYRVLGIRERREDYDAWLEWHRLLRHAPELEQMAGKKGGRMPEELKNMQRRPSRVSVRHAYERREAREKRRSRAHEGRHHIPRGILPRRHSRPNYLHIILVYVMALFLIVPALVKSCRTADRRHDTNSRDKREPGVSPLDEATQLAELDRFRERIVQAAQQGDPDAQFRYGCMLYHGSYGLPQDRKAALRWLRKAHAKGNPAATRLLKSLGEPMP